MKPLSVEYLGGFLLPLMKLLPQESYGMKAASIIASLTVESARQVSKLLDSLPRALFIHCHVSGKLLFLLIIKYYSHCSYCR